MAKRNHKKAATKAIHELLTQLILKAEKWGANGYYTPLKLEEMRVDAHQRLIDELSIEKANLEYEMHSVGTNKREALIKIERINTYITRAQRGKQQHIEKIRKVLAAKIGDKKQLALAMAKVEESRPRVSVLLETN
jgi:hypothetical protein